MQTWGITDTGLVRAENQDAYAVWQMGESTIAVVCDGMGGTGGGQLASRVAVETYRAALTEHVKENMSEEQLTQTLSYCVSIVNRAIRAEATSHPGYERMGTTLVSALVRRNSVTVLNVGDSRAYHISSGGIRQISRDHSVVESMVEQGELTPQEARRHPNRNLITRALGPEENVEADQFHEEWQAGDFLLLCSDGLVNTVTDQELLFEVIHGGEPENCLERLMALAKQRGAPDNVTAVLVMNA